jgi:hypothetical protein
MVWWGAGQPTPTNEAAWLLVVAVGPVAVGALAGLVAGVRVGADADDRGIHRVPAAPRSSGPWPAIRDIREERRRNRTIVAIYLDSGAVLQLLAPYDGRLLARDPDFERKVFTVLHLWETHRSWRSRL